MTVAIDTDFLVAVEIRDHLFHKPADAVLSRLLEEGHKLAATRAIFPSDDKDINLALLEQLEISPFVGAKWRGILLEEARHGVLHQKRIGGEEHFHLHALIRQLLLDRADEDSKFEVGNAVSHIGRT